MSGTEGPVAGAPASEHPPTTYEQLVEAAADLLQSASLWLRQEAEQTVREKVVLPLQNLGLTFVAAATAATLLVLGLISVFVGLLVFFGRLIGWDVTLWVLGGLLLAGSGTAIVMMFKKMQR